MTKPQLPPDTVQACAKFVMWALMEGSWQGADIDGGAAQDKAVELGLIQEVAYDPEKHGESDCCEPGDQWFRPSETLLSLLTPTANVVDAQGARATDSTLYVERSMVRIGVMGSGYESLLKYVDSLPIFTADDFRAPVSRPHSNDVENADERQSKEDR